MVKDHLNNLGKGLSGIRNDNDRNLQGALWLPLYHHGSSSSRDGIADGMMSVEVRARDSNEDRPGRNETRIRCDVMNVHRFSIMMHLHSDALRKCHEH